MELIRLEENMSMFFVELNQPYVPPPSLAQMFSGVNSPSESMRDERHLLTTETFPSMTNSGLGTEGDADYSASERDDDDRDRFSEMLRPSEIASNSQVNPKSKIGDKSNDGIVGVITSKSINPGSAEWIKLNVPQRVAALIQPLTDLLMREHTAVDLENAVLHHLSRVEMRQRDRQHSHHRKHSTSK